MKPSKEEIPNLMEDFDKQFDNEDEFGYDEFSPTSWDKHPDESEEDYEERIQDQEDFMEFCNE